MSGVEDEWLTLVAVAELAGCATATVMNAVHRGEIAQRPGPRHQASLGRATALAWVAARRAADEAQAERRRRRDLDRQLRGRPDLEHEWLTHTEVGRLLGLSRVRVSQLASAERLPFTVVDGRRWFRDDHIALVVRARAAQRVLGRG